VSDMLKQKHRESMPKLAYHAARIYPKQTYEFGCFLLKTYVFLNGKHEP
jgi:hypothetical protein